MTLDSRQRNVGLPRVYSWTHLNVVYSRCDVRLDIRGADLDMVGCNFDCFGHDVGHLSTHEWTRGDVNHTREYLIWVPEYVIWVPGNVMLGSGERDVGLQGT